MTIINNGIYIIDLHELTVKCPVMDETELTTKITR